MLTVHVSCWSFCPSEKSKKSFLCIMNLLCLSQRCLSVVVSQLSVLIVGTCWFRFSLRYCICLFLCFIDSVCLFFVFRFLCVFVYFSCLFWVLLVLYGCKWLPEKTSLQNELLCLKQDLKLYWLSHSAKQVMSLSWFVGLSACMVTLEVQMNFYKNLGTG